MIADISLSNEAWAAINSVAVAVTAIMAWMANRKRAESSAANSAAIAAVHEVAKTPAPSPQTIAKADIAVAAVTPPSTIPPK